MDLTERESREHTLIVDLKSGGTLTVKASTSFFKMSPEDQTFVFGIMRKLVDYDAHRHDGPVFR